MRKDYNIKKERVNRNLQEFAEKKEVQLSNFKEEDFKEFAIKYFKCRNRSSLYSNVRVLNDILEENEFNIKIKSKDLVDDCVVIEDERFFTLSEIKDICNLFQNYQDSFIVYALFCGIMGKSYEDLLMIKVSDVADDYSYINIKGKKFICDDYMKKILRGTIKANLYDKYVSSNYNISADHFYFNMDSEYLIKTCPFPTNNYGINPMASSSLQRRFRNLQEASGEEIILSGLNLVKSGIMYQMFLQSCEGKDWDTQSISDYLKMNGYKMNPNEIYRSFYNRYYGTNVRVY